MLSKHLPLFSGVCVYIINFFYNDFKMSPPDQSQFLDIAAIDRRGGSMSLHLECGKVQEYFDSQSPAEETLSDF